ncbi:hypothetical protein [Micromonospora vulcania]|uniref:Peptidase MA-like domain-containing protein n=1 Tax=Micromonospora vulcania TaxID=1441873 RepID=A0ABW1HG73_9ACTN
MGNRYDLRGLEPLDGFPFPVFVSAGGTARGQAVAQRAARTVAWLDRVVGMPETPPLFVVGTGEWDQVASIPLYGMPHVESDRIVVGQEPAPFWDSVTGAITPLLAPAGLRRLHQVYGDPIDLGPFADLLVSHELTHLAHGPSWPEGPVAFWVKELAANLGLQGYVTEVEPSETTRLETIFEVTWAAAPQGHWPVRDLPRMAQSLDDDGANYVWFEFGLQVLARRLWQVAGATALQRVVDALRGSTYDLPGVLSLLRELDPAVARSVLDWPRFAA